MPHYLVTGGAGFIGSNIVHELVRRGETIRVLDNFSTGKWDNLAPWLDRIEVVQGDIRDLAAVRRALEGIDYVLHQAALPSVPRSIADPLTSHEVNATGTLNLLLVACEMGVKRFIYASSSSVYGDTPVLPKREDMPTCPRSPYAVSKLAGENYCRAFYHVHGLETFCLRYFNVFGPRQDPASQYAAVIPRFIMAIANGTQPTVYGDGTQSRDFTYVANVVEANLLACRAGDAAGNVLNIACGQQFTLLQLMEQLKRILEADVEPVFARPRQGDVKHSLAAVESAQELLGYRPLVGFEEGLERTVAYYRAAGGQQPEEKDATG